MMRTKVKMFKLFYFSMPEYKRRVSFNNRVQVLEFEDPDYESIYEKNLEDEEKNSFFERLKKMLIMYLMTLKLLFTFNKKQI